MKSLSELTTNYIYGYSKKYEISDDKAKCLCYIALAVGQIMKFDLGTTLADFRGGLAAGGIFRTVHNYLRQKGNGLTDGNASIGISEEVEMYVSSLKIKIDTSVIATHCETLAGFFGVEYTKAGTNDNKH